MMTLAPGAAATLRGRERPTEGLNLALTADKPPGKLTRNTGERDRRIENPMNMRLKF